MRRGGNPRHVQLPRRRLHHRVRHQGPRGRPVRQRHQRRPGTRPGREPEQHHRRCRRHLTAVGEARVRPCLLPGRRLGRAADRPQHRVRRHPLSGLEHGKGRSRPGCVRGLLHLMGPGPAVLDNGPARRPGLVPDRPGPVAGSGRQRQQRRRRGQRQRRVRPARAVDRRQLALGTRRQRLASVRRRGLLRRRCQRYRRRCDLRPLRRRMVPVGQLGCLAGLHRAPDRGRRQPHQLRRQLQVCRPGACAWAWSTASEPARGGRGSAVAFRPPRGSPLRLRGHGSRSTRRGRPGGMFHPHRLSPRQDPHDARRVACARPVLPRATTKAPLGL